MTQKPIRTEYVGVIPTHADWTAVEITQNVVAGPENMLERRITLRIGGTALKRLIDALEKARVNLPT